jgi:hypothetical protein
VYYDSTKSLSTATSVLPETERLQSMVYFLISGKDQFPHNAYAVKQNVAPVHTI